MGRAPRGWQVSESNVQRSGFPKGVNSRRRLAFRTTSILGGRADGIDQKAYIAACTSLSESGQPGQFAKPTALMKKKAASAGVLDPPFNSNFTYSVGLYRIPKWGAHTGMRQTRRRARAYARKACVALERIGSRLREPVLLGESGRDWMPGRTAACSHKRLLPGPISELCSRCGVASSKQSNAGRFTGTRRSKDHAAAARPPSQTPHLGRLYQRS
jgi:hypothetical protein